MSVTLLPEWKQLLLERKRREEDERGRREKEEEEKFANMPAWKRGIIQRRKAKQDVLPDREKEREVCLPQVEVRSPTEGLSDTDSSVTVNLGSEPSLSPDPGIWLDAEPKAANQVSLETIVPVHENPFIRTQCVWRKGRDGEGGNELEVKEKEKWTPRVQDGDMDKGHDVEQKIDRFIDMSVGREKERAKDRSQSKERYEKERSQWKESAKEVVREQELLKVRKDSEEPETHLQLTSHPPVGPCLRTIRADNIIIIEPDKKCNEERRARWMEAEREPEWPDDNYQGKRGMKMDLREILAVGGNVTEIRASEVLIIKNSLTPEEWSTEVKMRDDREIECSSDIRRANSFKELRTDMSWVKEKERPWGQATVINKDEKEILEDNVFVERGGRVSQLLSKFGEHPKPPSRSKSSDNFLQPAKSKQSQDDKESGKRKEDWKNTALKGVPKRSFSFSDRVISAKENGLCGEKYYERKTRDRIYSDRSGTPWVDVASLRRETTAKIKLGCARLLDKERFAKYRDGLLKIEHRSEVKKVDPLDKRAAEKVDDVDGDKGFTVATVKNTEGISFARRVPIRQDVKARADRDTTWIAGEKKLEREPSVEKNSKGGEYIKEQSCYKNEDVPKSPNAPESSTVEPVCAFNLSESHSRHTSAFTDCSSLQSTLGGKIPNRGTEWAVTRPRGSHSAHSILSQHTEELINKIEKIGDTTVYSNDKEQSLKVGLCIQTGGDTEILRSPKKTAPSGVPQGSLEVQIPRTVFYVAEEMSEKKKSGQHLEEGREVERRDSWRVGKPLSRIESLRETIRQRELEKQQRLAAQDGDGKAAVDAVCERLNDGRRTEVEEQGEVTDYIQQRPIKAETEEEDVAAQTSSAFFDSAQEVDVLKTCPQLPASSSNSQEVREEEATAASEVTSDCLQIVQEEDYSLKQVEVELRHHRGEQENKEDEKELEEKELEGYEPPLDLEQTFLPSLPNPDSLTAMSRIYNLDMVGSRSGLYLKDRSVDISSSVQLVKVKPLESGSQECDSRAFGQLQHKQQEVLKSSMSPKRDTRGLQSPRRLISRQEKDVDKPREKNQEMPEMSHKSSSQQVCPPTSHLKQTISVTPSFVRSQSPDNFLRATNCAPTPASSPCSPSPSQSPNISPSPSPSPTLFSIRSASGGPVKRGATITITPKKPVLGAAMGHTVRPTAAELTSTKLKPLQNQISITVADESKKKYPTVDEIEVIGGYENLERSCLIKKGGTPKRGKVCFDEEQLEQVCEYPSETFMLAFSPYPHDMLKMERLQGDETQDDEGETEEATVLFKNMSIGITSPRLRVDESCPR